MYPSNTYPRLAIFDMAGTSVSDRSEVENAFRSACQQSGLDWVPEERIKALQGYSKAAVFRLLWSEPEARCSEDQVQQAALRSYDCFRKVLEAHYQSHPATPTEGALAAFAFLRERGISIALTTGFYRKVTDLILSQLNWSIRGRSATPGAVEIDFSISGEEVPKGRPAPDMIHAAMKACGVSNPSEVINFGDTPSDIESGRRAQCGWVVALTNGTHDAVALAPCNPDLLLPSLSELPRFFEDRYSATTQSLHR